MHARHFFKVRVARSVIAVAVGMNYDQLGYRAAFALGPFRDEVADKFGSVNLARAGVFKQDFVLPKNEVQERFFVVDTAGFPENVEVRIVFMHLPVRHRGAYRASGSPRLRH